MLGVLELGAEGPVLNIRTPPLRAVYHIPPVRGLVAQKGQIWVFNIVTQLLHSVPQGYSGHYAGLFAEQLCCSE